MAETFLLHVNLDQADSNELDGLDIKTIRCFDYVVVKVNPSSVDRAIRFVQREFRHLNITVDVRDVQDAGPVLDLLNTGAVRAVVNEQVLESLLSSEALADLSRLCLPLSTQTGLRFRDVFSSTRSGSDVPSIWVDSRANDATIATAAQFLKTYTRTIFMHLTTWDSTLYTKMVRQGITPIVNASDFTTEPLNYPDRKPVDLLFHIILKTDRADQLYPTVVVDERDRCLGMVYSSPESIAEALATRRGVYKSRRREGLWIKGDASGDIQDLLKIGVDCDSDTLIFKVRQHGDGFCHLKTETCFGPYTGLSKLEKVIKARKTAAPPGSYTHRLFSEPKLLQAKILEEASELGEAKSKEEVAFEAADLLYFAMTKCVAAGVDLRDVERNLDLKSLKISRRKGDAKGKWAQQVGMNGTAKTHDSSPIKEAAAIPQASHASKENGDSEIRMRRINTSDADPNEIKIALQRPSQRASESVMKIVRDIITEVREHGDGAVLTYTHKFEKATSLESPILRAPFPDHLMQVSEKTKSAIDTSFANIWKFHASQEVQPLEVETMSGVVCSRFSRPIERVGLYVPGGTAVLPSSAMMLGVPAKVAGCSKILLASPPRADGTVTPEIVYIAHKIGAEGIVLAGGAQAVAAMAYGTDSITKVDKILGPGNQFVTAAKMLVSNDTSAHVAIDMPAGPSEVLVIADRTADPAFVAADLLSQAEHGPDSQVVLIAVDLDEDGLQAIEKELHAQANRLPRVDIVRGAINHSVTLCVRDIDEALRLSNQYAPEHLILQIQNAVETVQQVTNAGSVFIGMWTPESVGDYSAGVNHSLPTYGYAKQYSGVNLGSFTKHITSCQLTRAGLENLGGAVMELAGVEGLDAHARAVSVRLAARS